MVKRPTIDKVAEHCLALAKSMWELSNTKVAITMGTLPAAFIIHFFPERIRVVCDIKYALIKDGGMTDGAFSCRVLLEYASPDDMKIERISRVVSQRNHTPHFQMYRAQAVTLRSYPILATERFLDLALLLSVGQVARPTFMSSSAFWYSSAVYDVCLNVANFDENNVVAVAKVK